MKKYLPLLLGLILLSSVLTYFSLSFDHDWGDDWASYVMQAVSITRGTERDFITHNTFTITQSTRFIGPDAYPWGFPTLLVPFVLACGPLNVFCLKFINLLFFALFLAAFYVFLIRRLPPLETFLTLAVLAFNPILLQFQDNVLSDIPFLFFSTLALLLIESLLRDDPDAYLGTPRQNIWIGVALFFAFFVRTNGLLLVPTLFLTQFFLFLRERPRFSLDWKRILTIGLIPYYVFAALTLALLVIFPAGEGSHLEHYSVLTFSALAAHLKFYFSLPAEFFQNLSQASIIYGILLPFFLGGAILNRKRDMHILIYIILSYILFITWPETQGIRFLFPLLPFFIYFAYRGMIATSFALTDQFQRLGLWLTRGLWLAILASFVVTSVGYARDNLAQERLPSSGAFDVLAVQMTDFISDNTPADSVVIFYKPRALHLITGRDSIMVDSCDALTRGDYVVIRKKRGAVDQVLPDTVTTCNPALTVTQLFDNQKYTVYRLTPK